MGAAVQDRGRAQCKTNTAMESSWTNGGRLQNRFEARSLCFGLVLLFVGVDGWWY